MTVGKAVFRGHPGRRRPSPDLPPGYTLVTLRGAGNAFRHACSIAGSAGAGTLVWVRRFDLVEFAVVLEPAEPLATARCAFFAGMTALADAVAAIAPPEKRISFDWPDVVRFDGARLGGGRLGWPQDCPEEELPAWLVFSAMLIASKGRGCEPGLTPGSTSLEEEGCDNGDHGAMIESFARYLMRVFDLWAESGFDVVAQNYLARLSTPHPGSRLAIDSKGELIAAGGTGIERLALVSALKAPAWLDGRTGTPLR